MMKLMTCLAVLTAIAAAPAKQPTELERLRAEVAALKAENAALKAEVLRYQPPTDANRAARIAAALQAHAPAAGMTLTEWLSYQKAPRNHLAERTGDGDGYSMYELKLSGEDYYFETRIVDGIITEWRRLWYVTRNVVEKRQSGQWR